MCSDCTEEFEVPGVEGENEFDDETGACTNWYVCPKCGSDDINEL